MGIHPDRELRLADRDRARLAAHHPRRRPVRQYSISTALLDKKDPAKILGRLREPLIHWTEASRSGYVPNVVYTCGVLLHNGMLVIPYAMSDQKSTISLISLPTLIEKLLRGTN